MKTSAFLVGEESLDLEAFLIVVADFFFSRLSLKFGIALLADENTG
jgi:hypothetical protein